MRNTFPKRALQDFCEHCCSWGIIRKCLTLKGFLPQEEMQKIMSCQQAFMKQENPPQSLWGKKKWVLVNQFIVNYCVYSTWPNTTLAIWGNENKSSSPQPASVCSLGQISAWRPASWGTRMRSAPCLWLGATAWTPAAARSGQPGAPRSARSVPWETHLSTRSSVPEDPDSPQKKLQMANGFSKVQWFQWLIALLLGQ